MLINHDIYNPNFFHIIYNQYEDNQEFAINTRYSLNIFPTKLLVAKLELLAKNKQLSGFILNVHDHITTLQEAFHLNIKYANLNHNDPNIIAKLTDISNQRKIILYNNKFIL